MLIISTSQYLATHIYATTDWGYLYIMHVLFISMAEVTLCDPPGLLGHW